DWRHERETSPENQSPWNGCGETQIRTERQDNPTLQGSSYGQHEGSDANQAEADQKLGDVNGPAWKGQGEQMFPGIFTVLDSCKQRSLERHKERQYDKAPEHKREVEHQAVPAVRFIENKFCSISSGKIDGGSHRNQSNRNE